jgi:hypothetical protein
MSRESQTFGVELRPALAASLSAPQTAAQIAYSIGGIKVGVFAPPRMRIRLDRELVPFQISAGTLDVRIDVDWTDHLAKPSRVPAFDSGGLWSVYEESDGYRFFFSTPFLGAAPYKSAWFDRAFRRGHLTLYRRYFDPRRALNVLEYPLDELLAIHRLSCGEGVEVHAVGVVDENNRGHLLLGHSGAGKSTSAKLWQRRHGVRVLSDDRIILRFENGRARMYGTPWHGDAGLALADSADLAGMYILQHGSRNQLTPLPAGRAAAELFARSFVPHHSQEGLKFTLRFLENLTQSISCSLFHFIPDQTAVETICHA